MFEIWEKMTFFANKVIKENWDFGNKIQPDPVQCQENCNCWTTVGQLLDNWDNWDTGPRSMPGPPSEWTVHDTKIEGLWYWFSHIPSCCLCLVGQKNNAGAPYPN